MASETEKQIPPTQEQISVQVHWFLENLTLAIALHTIVINKNP